MSILEKVILYLVIYMLTVIFGVLTLISLVAYWHEYAIFGSIILIVLAFVQNEIGEI